MELIKRSTGDLARWHESIGPLRGALIEAAKNARDLKSKAEGNHKRARRSGEPNFEFLAGNWQTFSDDGQLLLKTHARCVFRVSWAHYERALRLINAIAHHAVGGGFELSIEGDLERLELKRDGVSVFLRVSEKLEAGHRKEYREWSKTWDLIKVRNPTGRLTVYIGQLGGGETAIADQPNKYLEAKSDQIAAAIEARHMASIRKREEWARWEKERQAAERRRQEEARLAEEARKKAEAEAARRAALMAEVTDWIKADELRRYLSELDRRLLEGGIAASEFLEWRTWAAQVVADLDRSGARVLPISGAEVPFHARG